MAAVNRKLQPLQDSGAVVVGQAVCLEGQRASGHDSNRNKAKSDEMLPGAVSGVRRIR